MRPSRRGLHLAVAGVLLGNLALIVAWPLLRDSVVGSFAGPVYAELCHQMPGRCYQVGGEAMPVCARCLGVWLGLFAGAALAALALLPRRPAVAAGLLGWLVASWLLGYFLPEGWRLERTVAGLAGGLGLYLLGCLLPGRLRRVARAVRL
jgi:uncharacterized membrane protein